jgi:hypothetical protein
MDNHIVCECNVNERFLQILGFKPLHKQGLSSVIKQLEKPENRLVYHIGIIDKDKKQVSGNFKKYLDFEVAKEIQLSPEIIIRRKPDSKHFLLLHPNTEAWFVELAEKYGINHGFKTKERFIEICKSYKNRKGSEEETAKLNNFLNALKQVKNSPLKQVADLIAFLKNN